jgi:hypothetical protein
MSEGNGSTSKQRKREPLVAPRMAQAEFKRNYFSAVLEAGTTVEEIQEPMFWSYVGTKLRQFDRIEAIEESGAFFVELLVTACDRNWANVHVLGFHDLVQKGVLVAPVKTDSGHKVEWAGPHHKWRVLRTADNEVIRKEFQTEAEAQAWLADHLKKSSRPTA